MPLDINDNHHDVNTTPEPSLEKTEECMRPIFTSICLVCMFLLLLICIAIWAVPFVMYEIYDPLRTKDGAGWLLLRVLISVLVLLWPFVLALPFLFFYMSLSCFESVCEICNELNHYIWIKWFVEVYNRDESGSGNVNNNTKEFKNNREGVDMVNFVPLED